MQGNEKPKIVVGNQAMLNDLERTAISVSESIDNAIGNLPPELKSILPIAVGAALGCKFPKLSLFLGGIYLVGKMLSNPQPTVGR